MKQIRFVLRALKYKNYRLFFAGQSVSLIGTWIQNVAVGWLVYRMTHSAFLLGFVNFAVQFPVFLLTPFAGVFVDRKDRRTILIASQALAMIQALCLGFLVISGNVRIWQIIALSFFLGVVNALDMPARHAFVYEIVEKKEDTGNAIALHSSLFNGTRLIGPLIAGILLSYMGEGGCFLINGFSFIAVIAALFMIKIKKREVKKTNESVLEELKKGFVYAFGFMPIRTLILLVSAGSLMGTSYAVLMPVFATDILKGNAKTLGFLMSQAGLGAVIGAVYLASRKHVLGLCGKIAISTVLLGIGLILFSFSKILWFSSAALVLVGFSVMVQTAGSNTILQTIVDDDKRGRVLSIFIASFIGIMPFGSLLAGVIANKIGAPYAVFLGGVLCIFAGSIFILRLKSFRKNIHPIYLNKGIISKAVFETQKVS